MRLILLAGALLLLALATAAFAQDPHYAQQPQRPAYINGQMLLSGTWINTPTATPTATVSPSPTPTPLAPAAAGAQYKACLNQCGHMSNKTTYERDMLLCMPMCNSWALE